MSRAVRDFEKQPPPIREARDLKTLTSFMTYNFIKALRNSDVAWPKARNALIEAHTTSGQEGKRLLEEADTAFRLASKGKSASDQEMWHHWGFCLQAMASREPLPNRKDLYESALDKFCKALSINPERPSTLVHSAYALSMLALVDEDNAENLQAAKVRAKKAINLSSVPTIHHYYGVVLLNCYLLASQNAKTTLLAEAKDQFHAANNLQDGSGAMGLAFAAALNEDPSACRKWLEKSFINEDYVREELQYSPYLKSVQKEEWFLELLAQMN